MKFLSENTKITVGLVIAMVGGITWITRISYTAEATASTLEKVLEKQEQYNKDISEIRQDIAVIKTILKRGQ